MGTVAGESSGVSRCCTIDPLLGGKLRFRLGLFDQIWPQPLIAQFIFAQSYFAILEVRLFAKIIIIIINNLIITIAYYNYY